MMVEQSSVPEVMVVVARRWMRLGLQDLIAYRCMSWRAVMVDIVGMSTEYLSSW